MRLIVLFTTTLLLLFSSGAAHARPIHYIGGHPIDAKHGGGYCLIDAPHLHAYPPDHAALYQRVGDDYVFTADPTPFGYEGERHPFYGNHPVVTVGTEPVFCYIDGPHFHPFEAPDAPDYKVEKGVAFYVGAYPPSYTRLQPTRRKQINAEYRPYVAMRPTIEVRPPSQWQGEVWVAPPVVAVSAPGVVVTAPGVIFAPPPRVVVTAPSFAVSAPGVIVSAPGVVVGGGVYVEGRGRHDKGKWHDDDDDDDHRGHHDNGKHRGWNKHGH